MRRVILMVLAAVAASSSIGFSAFAGPDKPQNKVIAYYFHGSYRCYSCTMIEKYAKEAIEADFKDELTSGKLEFKAVDVEEPKNRHYVDEYQLYSKSLVISLIQNGKEVKSKNLEKVWMYLSNKQKFIGYVVENIRDLLKEKG